MKITDTYYKYATQCPDRPAIITNDKTISYREWNDIVQKTAVAFSYESAIHNRVAIFLPNGHLFLQIFAGAAKGGWASVVGDMRWRQREMEERLNETEPDIIIADDSMKTSLQHLSAKIIFSSEINNWLLYKNERQSNSKDNQSFYIGFTSGSTGKPKAFVRSHISWVETFRCNQVDLNIKAGIHILIPGSFVNSTFLYGALSTLYIGGTIYILKKYSVTRLIRALELYPISVVYVVPTMLQALIDEGWNSKKQFTFISTGAKLLPSMKKTLKIKLPHAHFHEFYGASELSYVTLLINEDQWAYGDSVGRPFHNVEISIRTEGGEEASPGEAGELYVRSPMLFDGYLKNEELTENVTANGWATVHDIAKRDEDGYVYILGRKNDMILYGGINIYPQEIEKVLKNIEKVEEVAVFGVKDSYWGEVVAACIKGDVSIKELKSYCLNQLSPYKIPRIWRKINHFPYTSGGKISRKELKKWLEDEIV